VGGMTTVTLPFPARRARALRCAPVRTWAPTATPAFTKVQMIHRPRLSPPVSSSDAFITAMLSAIATSNTYYFCQYLWLMVSLGCVAVQRGNQQQVYGTVRPISFASTELAERREVRIWHVSSDDCSFGTPTP